MKKINWGDGTKVNTHKKEVITITIAVHWIQARLINAIKEGKIDLQNDTLREMCKAIEIKEYPQIVKHHLESLVNLGAIQKMYGQYVYQKSE